MRRWSEVWLNEGFATYAEWLWSGHEGFDTPADIFNFLMTEVPADDDLWRLEIGDPGPRHLFDFPVYVRGAHDPAGVADEDRRPGLLHRAPPLGGGQNAGGNGDTAGLPDACRAVSGKQLGALFHTWLHTTTKPSMRSGRRPGRQERSSAGVPMAVKWLQTTRMPR